MGESDLLRLSIGIGQFNRAGSLPQGEFSEQLKLLSELEKLKRENDGLNLYVQQLEREKSGILQDKGKYLQFEIAGFC